MRMLGEIQLSQYFFQGVCRFRVVCRDARQAQLFNVAVQGPAIAKVWTGDAKLQVMPMDKVFVVMVADIHTELDAGWRSRLTHGLTLSGLGLGR